MQTKKNLHYSSLHHGFIPFWHERTKEIIKSTTYFIEDVDFIEESIRQEEGLVVAVVNQWLSNGKCNLFLVQQSS